MRSTVTPMVTAVVDYESGLNPGPTLRNFCVDAASGPYSKWNVRASHVFADDFCAIEYSEAVGRDYADVLSEFRALLPAISVDLAIAAGFENLESYRRFARPFLGRLRAARKAESRLSAVGQLNGRNKLVPIVRKLVEEDGMSCDKEDTDGRVRVVPPTWRSAFATNWLRSLDKSPLHPHGFEGWARESVKARVPKSLPVNFYSPVYLHSLDEVQYADLDPQPAVHVEI